MKTNSPSQSKKDLLGSNIIDKDIAHGTVDDVRHQRIKRGECPTCQRKTHRVKNSRFRSKREPLTVEGEVVNGICLRCNPLTKTPSAITAPSKAASAKSARVKEVPDTFVCDDDFTVASEITLDTYIEQQVPRRSNRYNSKPFESVSEETPMTNFRRDDDKVPTDIEGFRHGRRDRGRGQPSMPRVADADDEDGDEEDDNKWIATQRRQRFHPMSREMYLFTSERSLGVESTSTGVESNDGSENSTEHFGPPKNVHPFSRELYRFQSERSLLSNNESSQSSEQNKLQRQPSDKSLTLDEVIQNERVPTNNPRMSSMKREPSTTSMSAVSSDSGYSSDGQKIKSLSQDFISSGKKEQKVQTQADVDGALQKNDHSFTPAPLERERKPSERRPSRFSLRYSLNLKDLPLDKRRASDPSYDFETELRNSRNWNSLDILRDAATEANGEKFNLQDFRKEMEAELMAKSSEKEPDVHSLPNDAMKETTSVTDELSSSMRTSLSSPPSAVVRLSGNLKDRPPLPNNGMKETTIIAEEHSSTKSSSSSPPSAVVRLGVNLKDRPPPRRRASVATYDVETERLNFRNWSSLDILRDAAAEANGEKFNLQDFRKEIEAIKCFRKEIEAELMGNDNKNDAVKETATMTDELSSSTKSSSRRFGLNLKHHPPRRRRASVATCDFEVERRISRNWSSLDILRDATAEANGEQFNLQDFRKEMEAEQMAKGNQQKSGVNSSPNEATKEMNTSTEELSSIKSSLSSPSSAVVTARTTDHPAVSELSAGDIIHALQDYSPTDSSACCAFFEEACARLAELALITDNHTHLVELGVVQTLCDALHKHSSSKKVSLGCCAALANLSASSSTRDIMFGHGVIDDLFACIKAEFDCPEVDREAFRALVSLSDSSSETKQIISCDLDTIIATFYLHEADKYIQVATCSILERLSVDAICRTMIMAFPEVFDVLGSIIQTNPNKKTIEMDACSLLRNLSLEEVGGSSLRSVSFVPFVMITMAAHVDNKEIFENACFFLSTVGVKQPKGFGALCTEDGIKCIIHALQNNDTAISLLEACCLALRAAINDSDEHKKLCLSTGAIDAIICLIMVYPHKTSLLEAALTVLVSLSSKKKCVAAIAKAGGIGSIAMAMRSNPTCSGIIRNGSRFVKNVVKADHDFANETVPAAVSILSCIKEQVNDQVLVEELCKSLHYLVLKSENWADRIISADGIAVIETAMKHNDKNRKIVKECDVLLKILYNIN